MGDNQYRRYVEHRGRAHPGDPVITERALLLTAEPVPVITLCHTDEGQRPG